jgi:uncharacterized membrane protein (UPF0127 family)
MTSFLSPIVAGPAESYVLHNSRTGVVVAGAIEPAFDSKTRNRGLLGRAGLDDGSALILAPCSSIHTFFMRFAIDVLFVARDGRVMKMYSALPAWRVGFAFGAFAAIELPAGAAAASDTRPGDTLALASRTSLSTTGLGAGQAGLPLRRG